MRITATAVLIAAGVFAAGCGTSAAATPAPFTLTGDLRVDCYATGYNDIVDGAAVTVYDAAGTVVATGRLGKEDSAELGRCMWPITVPNVPATSAFYAVEVTHRGKVTVPAGQARAGDIHLTLGNVPG